MQRATSDDSTSSLLERGRYTLRRLQSEPETEALAADLAPKHDRLAKAALSLEAHQFERTVLTGRLHAFDADFDATLSEGNNHLLAYVRKDRDSDCYRTFLPSGRLAETVDAPFEDDANAAARIVAAAARYPDAMPPDVVARIVAAAGAVTEALTAIRAQNARIAEAETEVTLARLPLLRAYNELHPRLQLLFPDRPARVESFFQGARRRRSEPTPE